MAITAADGNSGTCCPGHAFSARIFFSAFLQSAALNLIPQLCSVFVSLFAYGAVQFPAKPFHWIHRQLTLNLPAEAFENTDLVGFCERFLLTETFVKLPNFFHALFHVLDGLGVFFMLEMNRRCRPGVHHCDVRAILFEDQTILLIGGIFTAQIQDTQVPSGISHHA